MANGSSGGLPTPVPPGTNSLQQSIDALTRALNAHRTAITSQPTQRQSPFGGSPWGGKGHGGGGMGGGGSNNGGSPTLNGTAASTAGGVWNFFKNYGQKNFSDLTMMNLYGSQQALQSGGTSQQAVNRLFGSNSKNPQVGATSTMDMLQAGFNINRLGYADVDPRFTTMKQQAGGMAYANPGMGMTAATQLQNNMYSSRSFYAMQALGYGSPIGPGGKLTSLPTMMNNIMDRATGGRQPNATELSSMLSQTGGLTVNLNALVRTGGITQSDADSIKNYWRAQGKATSQGMSRGQYSSYMEKAGQGDKNAQGVLGRLGLGSNDIQKLSNTDAIARTRQADISGEFDKGLGLATETLKKFNEALNQLINTVPGGQSMLGVPSGVAGTLGSTVGSGIGGALGAVGMMRLLSRSAGGAGGASRLGGLATRAGVGGAALLGGQAAGNAVQDGEGGRRDYYGRALAWGGVGAAIGSVVPGVGTAVGAGLGFVGGSAASMLTSLGGGATDGPGAGSSGKAGAGATGSSGGATASSAIDVARRFIGKPYKWGGSNPNTSFDCSGLVQWSYGQIGVRLPRVSQQQQNSGREVPKGEVRPGDLIFFGDPAYHVGMSIGNGQMIEAPRTGLNIREASDRIGSASHVRRILDNAGVLSNGPMVSKDTADGAGAKGPTQNGVASAGGNSGALRTGAYGSSEEAAVIRSVLNSGGGGLGEGARTATASGRVGQSGRGGDQTKSMPAQAATGTSDGSAAQNRLLGQRMAAQRGWVGDQWNALDFIAKNESSWLTTALNESSGAYGIPQSLPASKMAAAGDDWKTNPATQIRWMLDYIAGRADYRTPVGAKRMWEQRKSTTGHGWYESGTGTTGVAGDQMAKLHDGEIVLNRETSDIVRAITRGGIGGEDTKAFPNANSPALTKNSPVTLSQQRGSGSGGGLVLNFGPGSVVINGAGPMDEPGARNAARRFVSQVSEDSRLKAIARDR